MSRLLYDGSSPVPQISLENNNLSSEFPHQTVQIIENGINDKKNGFHQSLLVHLPGDDASAHLIDGSEPSAVVPS